MPTASRPISWRRSGSPSATAVIAAAKADIKPGNAMPLRRSMPIGTIVHNVEMKAGKGGQIARAPAPMPSSSAAMAAMRRSGLTRASFAWCGRSAWRRSARCRTRTTRTRTSARPAVTAGGHPPERPRRGDEPDRPPAWRRRRPHLGRPASGHAVGQADQGRAHALQQGDDEVHPSLAPPRRRKQSEPDMSRSVWKGPFVDSFVLKKAEKAREVGPQRGHQDLVAPLDDPAPVRGADLRRLQRQEAYPGATSPRT